MGGGGSGVEGELPGGQLHDGLLQQGGDVLGEPGGVHLVGAQQHHGPLGAQGDARRHKGPVYRGQPGRRHGTAPRVNAQQQIFKFRQPPEGIQKRAHRITYLEHTVKYGNL